MKAPRHKANYNGPGTVLEILSSNGKRILYSSKLAVKDRKKASNKLSRGDKRVRKASHIRKTMRQYNDFYKSLSQQFY